MMNDLSRLIALAKQGKDLQSGEMEKAIKLMMDGAFSVDEMAELLAALADKGEAVEEIVGAAKAMRSKMSQLRCDHSTVVDTCGTGGDGSGTFNISTAAAIVAAGAGVVIAKHGNRKVSSQSGSADVLTELGVNVGADQPVVERCLSKTGICFCFAPLFHESVKNVGAARQKLGRPTIFNLLGPLCNPAGAAYQLVGVGKPHYRQKLAKALQELGTTRAAVVHGRDGLCEISNADCTDVTIVEGDEMTTQSWEPHDFDLSKSSRGRILASDPLTSANLIRSVLAGEETPARDIVTMNAAAAIWLVRKISLKEAAGMAAKSIDSGAAREKLQELAAESHS